MSSLAVRKDVGRSPDGTSTRLDRLISAVPVLSVFVWLCALYVWLAWEHKTPWLFTDELELTQLSRGIAETGHAARRGVPHSFDTLMTYLTAPAWLIGDTHTAYAVAKYIGVGVMSSVVFPTYGLARMLVSRPAALFAAAGAAAVPALAYSSMLLAEPLAYPYAALALFLIAKAIAARRPVWIAGAIAASVVAPFVKGELALVPAIFVLAAAFRAWGSERARRWRAGWSAGDWAGAIVLVAGALILLSALISSRSNSWLVTTRYYKGRMIDYGLWAAGALTIGLGVLPVVAGLAALVRPRGEPRSEGFRAFAAVCWASLACFGAYTAVKAAYISTVFATRVEERNLIYLAPLLFVGTALWLERPRLRLAALAAATGLAAYLLVTTPYQLQFHLYSDALGLALVQTFNRNLGVDAGIAQWTMIGVLCLTVAFALAPRLLGGRRLAVRGALAAAAALTLAWNLAGAISAGQASNSFSRDFLAHLPRQLDWLDRATGGQPAVYLGQQITDANGIWLLEFWNRSLDHVWSLDGTAPGPGPILTPDLRGLHGELYPDPGARYVVADNGVNLIGTVVERRSHFRLYRIAPPLRLENAATGVYSDGWMSASSAYSQFATPGGRPGYMAVSVSRLGWRGPDKPGRVTIRVGRLGIGTGHNQQALMREVTAVRRWTIHSGIERQFFMRTPPPPIRVEVTVSPTFSPADYGSGDVRNLGAVVGFAFTPTLPPECRATPRRCS